VSDALAEGARALGIALDEAQLARLGAYAALLAKWNRVYNLTGLRDESSFVSHHLLDSLAVLPHLPGGPVADIGSGGGLPGIPLAIARPHWPLTLIESNHKKSAFLTQAKIELALDNLEVVCERVENWRPAQGSRVVISRAFSDLAEFVRLSAHLVADDGIIAAMKGMHPYEEIAQLPAGWKLAAALPLAVPGLEASRHLILVGRG
jgi:16S rRNA (guanine527-N7)-methyltransferase